VGILLEIGRGPLEQVAALADVHESPRTIDHAINTRELWAIGTKLSADVTVIIRDRE
jgi:hypothetical protein